MSSVNAVVCGINELTSSVLKILRTDIYGLKIIGFWNESYNSITLPELSGLRIFNCSFDELFLNNINIQLLIICSSPVMQHQLVNKIIDLPANITSANAKLPFVIIIPPVSPNYDSNKLKQIKLRLGIAMPMRKFIMSSMYLNHLNFIENPIKYKSCYQQLSYLPEHWILGDLENIHIRLNTISYIQNNEYSWLCESNSIGGGMLNLYCSMLIDLIYHLTGLHIVSVTCLRRTYEDKLNNCNQSIRRISADDYVMIMGELEVSNINTNTTDNIESKFDNKPVLSICVSSDLPYPFEMKSGTFQQLNTSKHDPYFKLKLEINGSNGSFFINESDQQILWIPKKVISPKSKSIFEQTNVKTKSTSTTTKNKFLLDNNLSAKLNKQSNLSESHLCELNGNKEIFSNLSNIELEQKSLILKDSKTELNNSYLKEIQFKKIDEITELAQLVSKNPTENNITQDQFKSWMPITFKESWTTWFDEFVKELITISNNNTNITSIMNNKLSDCLIASTNHWNYIQKVLFAINKSVRQKCWIDVITGERM